MLNKKMLSFLWVLGFVLFVPQWNHAQDILNPKPGPIQQLVHDLLPKTSSPTLSINSFARPADPTPVSTHEKFATFLAGQDFKSVLLLENLRPDLPIMFKPILILSAGQLPLDPVTVPAHSTATIDINAALKAHGSTETQGIITVKFDFGSYGPGVAVVQISDDKHHVYLNSFGQSPEEYWSGTSYDAVVWAPSQGAQGFISITNSSNETHAVHIAFSTKGQIEPQPILQIPARQSRVIPIDGLLSRSSKSAGGIHVEYEQEADETYTGAILVEGQIFDKKTGFAKNIHFVDNALPPTAILRTHFLMVGKQPIEDNFPADIVFKSVAAVRNIDDVPVTVIPKVKFIQDKQLKTVSLPSRSVDPGESFLIDFNEEQKNGHLPPDFSQGSLEMTPNTSRASIIGELFNFSQNGGYVVGPSFTSYPTRSTSSIWRIDESFQTTVIVENTASVEDAITLRLYSGLDTYIKTFNIAAGKIIKINIRDFQQNSIPDDNGNMLQATSGVLSLAGSHNTGSKLSYDKIIHDADQSDYVGLPTNPCDFVTSIDMWIDPTSGSMPFPVMKTYFWSQSGPADAPQGGSTSSNTSLAQISNNGLGDLVTFTPTSRTAQSVTINPPFPQEETAFCDACSSGDVTVVSAVVSGIRLADTFWTNPTPSAQGCFYASLACTPPTSATCTSQFGVGFAPSGSCPNFMHSVTLVIGSTCIPPSADSAASGAGSCN